MTDIDTELEQLHQDAQAALEGKMLHDLDFTPICEYCRVMHHKDVPAAFVFACRGCHSVELRCDHCTAWMNLHMHTPIVCSRCHLEGCFHQVIAISPLGGAA